MAFESDPPSDEQTVAALRRVISRLAYDIHDGPLQNLAVIGLDLRAMRDRVRSLLSAEDADRVDIAVDQVVGDLVDVERSLRELLGSLERQRAESRSLVEALQGEIAEFERHSPASVELVVTGACGGLNEPECATIHAIARAPLANVSKHAEAHNVTVRLRHDGKQLLLEIEDDGRGFNVLEAYRPGHFGLRSIRERAELAGGHADIMSRPGGPTLVSARLSYGQAPARELLAAVS
jgi:signal transduction histidine kinase